MKWCDEGIYLLASQPVDKCQSQDGAQAALQEIEKFLETGAGRKLGEPGFLYQEYASILTQDLRVPMGPGLRAGGRDFMGEGTEDMGVVMEGCEGDRGAMWEA